MNSFQEAAPPFDFFLQKQIFLGTYRSDVRSGRMMGAWRMFKRPWSFRLGVWAFRVIRYDHRGNLGSPASFGAVPMVWPPPPLKTPGGLASFASPKRSCVNSPPPLLLVHIAKPDRLTRPLIRFLVTSQKFLAYYLEISPAQRTSPYFYGEMSKGIFHALTYSRIVFSAPFVSYFWSRKNRRHQVIAIRFRLLALVQGSTFSNSRKMPK